MKRAIPALALAAWIGAACVSRTVEPRTGEDEPVVVGRVEADGTFRSDTLGDGTADTTRVERETVTSGTIRPAVPSTANGWRIQVFADTDRARAEAFAREVTSRVDGHPVYVEWAEPWWKVRVGDFLSPDAAERLRQQLIADGVEGAWTVRTTVRAGP